MESKFSAKWFLTAFCLFVWFQFVTTFLLKGLIVSTIPSEMNKLVAIGLVWLFVIALVLGYRTAGTVVWETTGGSVLYMLMMVLFFNRFWLAPMKNIYLDRLTGLTLLVGALAFAGSWLGGKLFQLSRRQEIKAVSQ
ncbi:MAG: hypothetical protein HYZ01_04265 [Ignavibacteriales bacterium]|nr:hypothetical protein [Ignavibacteriales bacterium]